MVRVRVRVKARFRVRVGVRVRVRVALRRPAWRRRPASRPGEGGSRRAGSPGWRGRRVAQRGVRPRRRCRRRAGTCAACLVGLGLGLGLGLGSGSGLGLGLGLGLGRLASARSGSSSLRRTSPRLEWQSEQFALRRSPHSKSCSACRGIGLQPAAAQGCSLHTYGYGREHTGLQAPLHGAHGVAAPTPGAVAPAAAPAPSARAAAGGGCLG